MRISVITPCLNAMPYIEDMFASVASQATDGLEIEHIVLDAGSSDGTRKWLEQHGSESARLIFEPDQGPADAINKGLALASGEVLAWLNADDLYAPEALRRVRDAFAGEPDAALCFGHCPIMDEAGREIRRSITRFKEFWYPLASRPMIQALNFVSQPAMFFRRSAFEQTGPLRTDLKAAWDYEFLLRLWRQGRALRIRRPELAYFRWTPSSISGQNFRQQFREEYEAAAADAGRWAPQVMLHWLVRWGIVGIYSLMAAGRTQAGEKSGEN